ncbi:hypothetical protein JKY72_04090 [Candidatus Gracilibacteria bacterium]|nr:hypothetical protein [Candidatus Gracilibacteria bacterium]
MKILKLLTVSLVIFSACTATPVETEKPAEPKPEKTTFSDCTDDDCLLNHAWISTFVDNPEYDGVCDAMDEENWQYSQCQWNFSMILQEPERCDNIKNEWANELPEYRNSDHISLENCQLQFNHPQWKLSNGIPPYADPFTLTYVPQNETVEIEGWIVYKSPYVGPEVAHFHVKDAAMLPPLMGENSDFLMIEPVEEDATAGASPALIKKLKQYSEDNPGTLSVNMAKYHIEGSPWIVVAN